jgi:protein-tyrosine-phosphatase
MASAWFNALADRTRVQGISAGTHTIGCGEECPVVPGLRRMDWPLEDPKGKPVERVREIRDEVRERIAELIAAEGWAKG